MELLYGGANVALAHFWEAAKLDPDYRFNHSLLAQGVWTYVGRAYYKQEDMAGAREALERARSRYTDDYLAALYLGLVFAREGDQRRALREIEAGLRGLAEWLDYLHWHHPDGRFWDPARKLRSEIQRELEMIEGKDFRWSELMAGVEWLGREFEEEMDRAQRDERRHRRDRDNHRGRLLVLG